MDCRLTLPVSWGHARSGHEGRSITVGHQADLIAVDGNPLENTRLLADPARAFKLILMGGQIVKNDVLH